MISYARHAILNRKNTCLLYTSQFTTGFFFGKPTHETQIYDNNTYQKLSLIHIFLKIMGLDYGSVTVGVAISDSMLLTAQPVEVIKRKSENKLRQTLARDVYKRQSPNSAIASLYFSKRKIASGWLYGPDIKAMRSK